jgi:tRNA(adenine34) deaminase
MPMWRGMATILLAVSRFSQPRVTLAAVETTIAASGAPASDVGFMHRALELAGIARAGGEVPVGAVLVLGGRIVAEGANRPIAAQDPTAHAEIEALRAGGRALGSYRLTDTTLYVTLEPCAMCASAIVHARVRRLVFGTWDLRAGAAGSIVNVFALPGQNHRVDVFGGVLADECRDRLRQFFAGLRL